MDAELLMHLRARLEELSQPGRYGPAGRILMEKGDGPVLDALLQEVEQTILPRLLQFNRDGHVLTLEVADRRVQRIVEPGDDTTAQMGWADAVDPNDAAMLSEWIAAKCEDVRTLAVKTAPASKHRNTSLQGVSATALREAFGNRLVPLTIEDANAKSLRLVEGAITSNDDVLREPRAEGALSSLRACRDAKAPLRSHRLFEAWLWDNNEGWWTAHAGTEENGCWYVFSADHLSHMAQIWARVEVP